MNKNLRLICPLCRSKHHQIIFPSTFNPRSHLTTEIFSARRSPDRVHGTIVKCIGCGLVRTLEIINPTKLKSLYQRSSFTYQNLLDNLRQSYGQIISDASKYCTKGSFLEIGCGNGFVLGEAKKIGFKKVIGVEPSHDAVGQASKRMRSLIKNDFFRPNIFPKNSFDMISAFQVFDHVPDPNKFLNICLKILKPEGILVLMNHDVEALSAKILGEKSPIFDIEHTYLYSQKTITKIIEKNGFKIVKVRGPLTMFSLRHISKMLPIPKTFKSIIDKSSNGILEISIRLNPGNLCLIARKPLEKNHHELR